MSVETNARYSTPIIFHLEFVRQIGSLFRDMIPSTFFSFLLFLFFPPRNNVQSFRKKKLFLHNNCESRLIKQFRKIEEFNTDYRVSQKCRIHFFHFFGLTLPLTAGRGLYENVPGKKKHMEKCAVSKTSHVQNSNNNKRTNNWKKKKHFFFQMLNVK